MNPAIQCVGGSLLVSNTFRLVAVCVYSVLAVMTLSSPLPSLSLCRIMNKYQWMIGRNLDTVDKKVTCYCVVIVSICLFVCVLL